MKLLQDHISAKEVNLLNYGRIIHMSTNRLNVTRSSTKDHSPSSRCTFLRRGSAKLQAGSRGRGLRARLLRALGGMPWSISRPVIIRSYGPSHFMNYIRNPRMKKDKVYRWGMKMPENTCQHDRGCVLLGPTDFHFHPGFRDLAKPR